MNNRLWLTAASGAVLVGTALADSRFPIEDRETVRRSLSVPSAAAAVIEVSNINGGITVTGGDEKSIDLVAERTIRARTEADRDEAKRAVRLETRDSSAGVLVCGDASRRCGCDERASESWRYRDEPPYRVETHFELRVPRTTAVRLCSINGGRITVTHTTGTVQVEHVNGGIDADDIRGATRLSTVNGSIHASYPQAPPASSFRSVNGSIVASFPKTLAADLRLKTMNGGLFTDFETTPLPRPAATAERRGSRFVYRSSGAVAVRVGSGGPELSFETLNGDVRVLQR
jgi:hypothetical protein